MKKKILVLSILQICFIFLVTSCGPTAGVKEENPNKTIEKNKTTSNSSSQFLEDNQENLPDVIIEDRLDSREMIQGYRIKVATKSSNEEADMLEKTIVDALDVSVYVEFIIDKYMVYAGDCQNKAESKALKLKLNQMGFDKIYAVPKKVYKRIDFNKIEDIQKMNTGNIHISGVEDFSAKMMLEGKQKKLGYRVQIFAGSNKENALQVKQTTKEDLEWDKIKDQIYIVLANNLYKVQIGDFRSKIEAESLRNQIKSSYQGAFIVKSTVFENVVSQPLQDRKEKNTNITTTGKFFIQIGAFSTPAGAEISQKRIKELGYKCQILEDSTLFKVLVGGYSIRVDAENVKEKLMNVGFEGAWIMEK